MPAVGTGKDLADMEKCGLGGPLGLCLLGEKPGEERLRMTLNPVHTHWPVSVTVLSLDMAVVCKVKVELCTLPFG